MPCDEAIERTAQAFAWSCTNALLSSSSDCPGTFVDSRPPTVRAASGASNITIMWSWASRLRY